MEPDPLRFDAVILAGGRSSRLGGVPKQGLRYDGETLLSRAAAAAGGARAAVVVGPDPAGIPEGFLSCREQPPFSGPAAAVAAGIGKLGTVGGNRPRFTLVLACDMPNVRHAVAALRTALAAGALPAGSDGVVAVTEDGRRQHLVGFYATAALERSAAELASSGKLINGSVRALLASLDVQLLAVPASSTADVDTWEDAAALGVAAPDFLASSQENVAAADDLGGRT